MAQAWPPQGDGADSGTEAHREGDDTQELLEQRSSESAAQYSSLYFPHTRLKENSPFGSFRRKRKDGSCAELQAPPQSFAKYASKPLAESSALPKMWGFPTHLPDPLPSWMLSLCLTPSMPAGRAPSHPPLCHTRSVCTRAHSGIPSAILNSKDKKSSRLLWDDTA